MYFLKKGICSVQWALGLGEFSRIFVLKITLHSVRLLLTEKLGEQAVLVATALLAPPVPARMLLALNTL